MSKGATKGGGTEERTQGNYGFDLAIGDHNARALGNQRGELGEGDKESIKRGGTRRNGALK